MHLSLRPHHVGRYREIATLLAKHGRSDLARSAGLDDDGLFDADAAALEDIAGPQTLAADLERLGPTFVKLGQLLSSRSDLLRPEYIDALARLQDDCEPFPFSDVEKIVQEELGVRMSRLFSEFEDKPIAAASLGRCIARDCATGARSR